MAVIKDPGVPSKFLEESTADTEFRGVVCRRYLFVSRVQKLAIG